MAANRSDAGLIRWLTSSWWVELQSVEDGLPHEVRRLVLPVLGRRLNPYEPGVDRNFIFIHIPKTAGTSVARHLGYSRARHISAARYAIFDRNRFERGFKFCFVRNPWDRLLSAYTYLYGAIGINRSRDVRWAESNLAAYPSFECFVLALGDPAARRHIMKYIHFRSQSSWIEVEGCHDRMDFVGRFEQLEQDMAFVSQKVGANGVLPKTRTSHHAHYREAYSGRMRAIVRELYADDIARFGYNF